MAKLRASHVNASSQIRCPRALQASSHPSLHRRKRTNIASPHEHDFDALWLSTGYYTEAATVIYQLFILSLRREANFFVLIADTNTTTSCKSPTRGTFGPSSASSPTAPKKRWTCFSGQRASYRTKCRCCPTRTTNTEKMSSKLTADREKIKTTRVTICLHLIPVILFYFTKFAIYETVCDIEKA